MRTCTGKLITMAGLAVLLSWSTPVQAEVAAILDGAGNFIRTEIRQVRRNRVTSVWLDGTNLRNRGRRNTLHPVLLNEAGASRGDGVPSVAVHPFTGLPWAVWSFNDGGDYELAFSIFDGRHWSSPTLLGAAPNGQDDMEPKIVFTASGRPIIVWWRLPLNGSVPSVWLTTRANGAWQPPIRLSSSRRSALRPALLLEGDHIIVAYQTDAGVQMQKIPVGSPAVGGKKTSGGHDGPDPPTNGDPNLPDCQLVGCTRK
ncbi:MAG: hypothetical protein ACE5ID_11335 [Acidobacteriota bacterium]